ncbi:MAG: extracellular solute-binding protein [Oscillospiraceae bacterium]|nr:extracellular solute-binding protein [Oscillospiraceae bacterium]
MRNLVFILVFVLVTGCVVQPEVVPPVVDEVVQEQVETVEPESISWLSWLHTEFSPSDDVIDALSEIVGEQLELNWQPNAERNEILTSAIGSRSLGDLVSLMQFAHNTVIRQAIDDGLFWDIEPFLDDYPNLAQIDKDRLEGSRVNGKLYGIPFQKPYARYGLLIRKDWLDNLGLEPPKTFDDVMELARAFTEDDPDGNGIDDTVGLVERDGAFSSSFRNITGYFGAPNYFSINEQGQVISAYQHDGFFTAAEKMRELYSNGYVNQDWVTLDKDSQIEYVINGKGGMVFMVLTDARIYNIVAILADEPDPGWVLVGDIEVEGIGRRVISDTNNGIGGLLAIPTTVSEERLPRVLSVLDKLSSKEAFVTMSYGIEGVHYEITDSGIYKTLDEEAHGRYVHPMHSSRPNELWMYEMPTENELDAQAIEWFRENEKYVVLNDCQTLHSQTHFDEWGLLFPIMHGAYAKYVLGEINLNEFLAERDRWLEEGGQRMIDEYEADYAAQ